jgi:Bacterial Ig domain
MHKTYIVLVSAFAGLMATAEAAQATCKGNFRLEFGHTNPLQWTMPRNTSCGIQMQFDYVAFYGLSVRQAPRNGTIQMNNHYTFTYIPKKGYAGQDSFIIDAEGAPVNYLLGTTGQRSKAGMAFTMTVQ